MASTTKNMGTLDDENARVKSIEDAMRDANIVDEDAVENEDGEGGDDDSDHDGSGDEDGDQDDGDAAEEEASAPPPPVAPPAKPRPSESPAKPKSSPKPATPSKPPVKSKLQELKEKNAAKAGKSSPASQSGHALDQVDVRGSSTQRPHQQAPAQRQSVQRNAPGQQQGAAGRVVGGKNIGSSANEPKWTREDLDEISAACATRVPIVLVNDTRRNKPDPARRYVKVSDEGTTISTVHSMLPNLDLSKIKIGFGNPRVDEKLQKGKCYSDVVCVGIDNDWVLNQWTVMDVVMEPVDEKTLNRPPRMINGRPERRIGEHFARFGFPKKCLGPILETVNDQVPGILEGMQSSVGYYWTNASWGVNANPGSFTYVGEGQQLHSTPSLPSAMRMLGTKSSRGIATIAISMSSDTKVVNGRSVPGNEGLGFSIKCHNFVHLEKVDWHGAPQAASTGMELSNDILSMAQTLTKPAVAQSILSQTGDIFQGSNPFAPKVQPQQQQTQQGSNIAPSEYL